MIEFKDVHITLGSRSLFTGASFTIPAGARIGLIGPNGCGKTTLFNLALGKLAPDQGEVHVHRGRRLAHLPQLPEFPPGSRVRRHVLESHPTLWDLLGELCSLETQMESEHDPVRLDRLVERHRRALREYEEQGGREHERRVDHILERLGLPPELHDREIEFLSGGEKMRVALARIIDSEADAYLLDEPTNYLDIEMLEWLEEFLTDSQSAILVSSHDRYFLNRVVREILEVRDRSVFSYHGNYDDYVRQRSEEIALAEKLYQEQQREIAHDLEFIRRNFYGQKARQAKSRENRLRRLEILEAPRQHLAGPSIRFDRADRSGDNVLEAVDLACGHGGAPLLEGISLDIRKGERIAILGRNGTGKTTVLRTLAGELAPIAGSLDAGSRTRIAYHRQEQTEENSARAVFDEIHDLVPRWTDLEVRNLLAAFLFREDRITVAVQDLSGGEKTRLSLMRLVLSQANLLILDEPTTHLDILAREALERGLEEFSGTVLFVSHDRYFIERLADRVLFIEDGALLEAIGGFQEYRAVLRRSRDARAGARADARDKPRRRDAALSVRAAARARQAAEMKLVERISSLEEKLRSRQLEAARQEVFRDPEAMRRLKTELAELEAEIAEHYRAWEAHLDRAASEE